MLLCMSWSWKIESWIQACWHLRIPSRSSTVFIRTLRHCWTSPQKLWNVLSNSSRRNVFSSSQYRAASFPLNSLIWLSCFFSFSTSSSAFCDIIIIIVIIIIISSSSSSIATITIAYYDYYIHTGHAYSYNVHMVDQLKWSQLTLPIKMHKRVIIQQCYFIKKQVVICKNIINAKANKCQQNQTILP